MCLFMFLLVLGTCHIIVNKAYAAEEVPAGKDLSVLENVSADVENLYENAISSMDKKDYQSAIVYLTNYISSKPKKYEAYKLRGDCFYALRQYILAQQDYQKSIELKTSDDKFITGTKVLGAMVLGADKEAQLQNPELGNLYARLMYAQKALNNSAYEGSLAKAYEYNSHIYLPRPKKEDIALINCPQKYGKMLNPEGVDKYIFGAIEDIEKGDFNEAVYKIEYVISNYPKFYLGYYLSGVAMVGLDKENDAIAAFENALKYNPYDFESLASLGQIYYTKAEKTFDSDLAQKSIEYFTQALKYNPNCYLYYFYIGLNELQIGNFDSAISKFNDAIKIKSNDYNSMYYRMIAQYIKGDYKTVVDNSTKMLYRHVSNYNSVLYLRALAYNKLGNTNLALADLEKIQNGVDDIYNSDLKNVSEKEKTLEDYIYYLKAQIMNELGFGAKADMDKALKNPIIAKLASVDKSLNSFEDALNSSSISPEDYNKYNTFYLSELPKLIDSNLEVSLSDIDNQYDYIRTTFDNLGITFKYKNPNYKLATIDNYVEKRYSSQMKSSETNISDGEETKMLKQSTDQLETLVTGSQSSIAQMLATNSLGMVTTPPTQVEEYSPVATIAQADIEEQTESVSEVNANNENTVKTLEDKTSSEVNENTLQLREDKVDTQEKSSEIKEDEAKEQTLKSEVDSETDDISKNESDKETVVEEEKEEIETTQTNENVEKDVKSVEDTTEKSDEDQAIVQKAETQANQVRETHAKIDEKDLEVKEEPSDETELEKDSETEEKISEEVNSQENSEPIVLPEDKQVSDRKIPVPIVVVPELENKDNKTTEPVKQFVQKLSGEENLKDENQEDIDLQLRSQSKDETLVANNIKEEEQNLQAQDKSLKKRKEKKNKKTKNVNKTEKETPVFNGVSAGELAEDAEKVEKVEKKRLGFFKRNKSKIEEEKVNPSEIVGVSEIPDKIENSIEDSTDSSSQSLVSSFVQATFGGNSGNNEEEQMSSEAEDIVVDKEKSTKLKKSEKKIKEKTKQIKEEQPKDNNITEVETKKFSFKNFFAKFKKAKKEDLVNVEEEKKVNVEEKATSKDSFLPLKEIKSVEDSFDEPYTEEESKEIEQIQKSDMEVKMYENVQEQDVNKSKKVKVKKQKKEKNIKSEDITTENKASVNEDKKSKKSAKKSKKSDASEVEKASTIDKNVDPLDDLQPLESLPEESSENSEQPKKEKKLHKKSETAKLEENVQEEKKKVHVPTAKDKYEVVVKDDKKKTIIKQMAH